MKKGHNAAGQKIWQEEAVERIYRGKQRIAGTDFPIEDVVYRVSFGSRVRYWLAVFDLCNGVPTHSRRHRTRWEAIDSLGGTTTC